jgi:NADH-quinone oxidoreductase subunit H
MTPTFNFWFTIIAIVVVVGGVLGTCAYLILLERKIAAWTQDRLGPNRVGPWGLLQPIADGLKFLLKEDITPSHVDKVFFLLAPAIAVGTALFAIAVVPWGATESPPQLSWRGSDPTLEQLQSKGAEVAEQKYQEQVSAAQEQLKQYNEQFHFIIAPNIDVGFLFVFAVGSLSVYGIILGGWSSNNKYSLLGSLRSSAQIISYEIPMGMAVMGVVLMSGSLNLETIIGKQVYVNGWNIVYQPLAFLLFLTAIFAECNRMPFDLPEAEQELIGGYHTEYSSMKFALFFLGEYAHMITTSFVVVALFLGGWYIPWIVGPDAHVILKVLVIVLKMFFFIVLSMFIRWTIPRFRFDQLMGLAWKVFIPLTLVNLVCVMVVVYCQWPLLILLPVTLALPILPAFLKMYSGGRQPRPIIVVWRGHDRVEIPSP